MDGGGYTNCVINHLEQSSTLKISLFIINDNVENMGSESPQKLTTLNESYFSKSETFTYSTLELINFKK